MHVCDIIHTIAHHQEFIKTLWDGGRGVSNAQYTMYKPIAASKTSIL